MKVSTQSVESTLRETDSSGASSQTADSTLREPPSLAPFDAPFDAPGASATQALDAAVAALAPVVMAFPNHLVMQNRRTESTAKYLTRHTPLTPRLIAAHLEGRVTLGAGLYWPDPCGPGGRKARVIAWDSDDDLSALTHGAARLRRKGLLPLLVRNPSKPSSGHLWLVLDEPVDPAAALAAAETIAPELAAVPERFPHPSKSDGARLRLPGGYYLPVGGPPVPVEVAIASASGSPTWVDGTTSAGWRIIAGAVSRAAVLSATYLPPAARARLRPARTAPPVQVRRPDAPAADGNTFFARFNADHPIEGMVDVERGGKFAAPWRDERTASVHLYDDGHWHDFGPSGRHGRDAFDLWCAINGYWDEASNRPDRRAACASLKGCHVSIPTPPSAPVAVSAFAPPSAPVAVSAFAPVPAPQP